MGTSCAVNSFAAVLTSYTVMVTMANKAPYDSLGFVANLHLAWPKTTMRDIGNDLVNREAALGSAGTFTSYLDARVDARKGFFTDSLRAVYDIVRGAMGPSHE
jgi:hypothetical protein